MEILFQAYFRVARHAASKNEKTIRQAGKGGRSFIGKKNKTLDCEALLLRSLYLERLRQHIDIPIVCDINAQFIFYFPKTIYFTKKGIRSQSLPDLSNLYELPQDCLQKNQCPFPKKHPQYREQMIIGNDTQICSHDGSRREPIDGTEYYLKIILTKMRE